MTIESIRKPGWLLFPGWLLLAGWVFAGGLDPPPPASASRPAASTIAPDAVQVAIDKAFAELEADDASGAVAAFEDAIRQDGFAALAEGRRFLVFETYGETLETLGDHAKAHALFVRATGSSQSREVAWHNRLDTAYTLRDFVDAAHCVAVIARRWPESLTKISASSIGSVDAGLGEGQRSENARFEMLDALHDAHWQDASYDVSEMWPGLVRLLLDRQDIAKARKVAGDVREMRAALSMRIDKRYDAVTRRGTRPDIDRLAAQDLAAARREASRAPHSLRRVVLLISRLLDTMRYREALHRANRIVAMANDGTARARFGDFDDQYNWILDYRERALLRLGRVREAVRELQRAARQAEHGEANVSQAINLGFLYAGLGRPSEALDAVRNVGDASPYGLMQVEYVRLWACLQLRDATGVAAHMAFLREHRSDAMETWNNALVLSGKSDEAASELIARLRSPRWRTAALVDMQAYGGVRRPRLQAILHRDWLRIQSRPDVRRQLRKVGRRLAVHIDPEPS